MLRLGDMLKLAIRCLAAMNRLHQVQHDLPHLSLLLQNGLNVFQGQESPGKCLGQFVETLAAYGSKGGILHSGCQN